MKSTPEISVITATWSCANTITDCLKSFADQTWNAKAQVVIDGASKDGTLELLQANREQLQVLISENDNGIYDALNKGIINANGEVVGFLHADDVYAHPDVLRWVAEAFADSTVDAVYGDLEYVRQDDLNHVVRYWQAGSFRPDRLAWGWMPPHPTLYVRRKWYERIGGFDTRYRIAADYDSVLRLFNQTGFKVVYVPRVFVKMRLGGNSNRSLKNLLRKSLEDYKVLRRNKIGGLFTLLCKNLRKLPQFLGCA